MIGNDQGVRSLVHCAAGILSRVDTFYHYRPVPCCANPLEVLPSHNRLFERRSDIGVQHRPFSRNDDILKSHQSAVSEKSRQPARFCQKLIHKRKHRAELAAEEFFGAVTEVAFPQTRHWRIDRDNES